MGFFDLFRAKWKHSDPAVRLEAVKQLGAEDADSLAEVARKDREVKIRRAALKKIDNLELLSELAEHDPDEGLRTDAAEKAGELQLATVIGEGDESRSLAVLERLLSAKAIAEAAKRASHESVRRAALARLSDEKAIAEVARRADDPHVRRQAVERLDDPALLREIAISDATKEVGLAALERIDDLAAIEAVIKKTRSKAVRNAAKERLAAHKEKNAPPLPGGMSEAKRRSRQALLCRIVEEAAASDDWDHAQAAIESARPEWVELGTAPGDEPFQKRFERAIVRFGIRREEHQRKLKALAHAEAVRAHDAEDQAKRREASKVEDAARAEEDRKLREVAEAARKVEDERRAAERAHRAEEKARRDEEKARRDAEKAAEREKRDAEAVENLRRLDEVSARLESLADSDDKKAVESALKSAQEVIGAGGSLPREKQTEAKARYQKARDKLATKLGELKDAEDWKRWANVPRLEALCAKMDALLTAAQAEGADLKPVAAELKTLQGEWKQVGAAPKSKSEALWKRFKAASDQVYEKVKGQRQQSDEEKAKNLTRKEELCARVETLAQVPDAEINWKETAETIKLLQEEWKGLGQAPTREQGDQVWKRFRGACDQFFDRRKAHFVVVDEERGESLKKLEELCARVETLAAISDAEINWKETAERIKAAQAEWKDAGHPPKREQADALWKRFRGACDQFFDRRKAHFDVLDAERAENLKKKELLCEKVEALSAASGEDREAAMAETRKLQAEWKQIGPVPLGPRPKAGAASEASPKSSADAVWDRFRAACDVIFDRGRAPEPEPAVKDAPAPSESSSRFENRLPLAGVAEKLAQAASEWEALADAPEKPKDE